MGEENLTCSECGESYESNSHTRKIKNQLGTFVCPECLVEFKKNAGQQKEEPEAEETAEEEAPAAPARPPARPPARRP